MTRPPNPYTRKQVPVALVFLASLAGAISCLWIGGKEGVVGYLGGTLIVVALLTGVATVALPIMRFQHRVGVDDLLRSNLAHWELAPHEFSGARARFQAVATADAREPAGWTALVVGGVGAMLLYDGYGVAGGVWLGAAVPVYFGLVWGLRRVGTYSGLAKVPIVIGRDKALIADRIVRWSGFGERLWSAEVDEGEGVLTLQGIISSGALQKDEIVIPVPPAQLEAAREVARILVAAHVSG